MAVVVVSGEDIAPHGREALPLAATEALNFAVGLSSAAAVAVAAPAAAAFSVLASAVQHCPWVDLQVRPTATQPLRALR